MATSRASSAPRPVNGISARTDMSRWPISSPSAYAVTGADSPLSVSGGVPVTAKAVCDPSTTCRVA